MPTRADNRTWRQSHPNGQPNKWERRNIVAWDGEGYTREDGAHIYNLLARSGGHHIVNNNGLSTDHIFEFLLSQSEKTAINVIFAGGYDVNMWLRDVPYGELIKLWRDGKCAYKHYIVRYQNRKKFSISEKFYTPRGVKKPHRERSIVIWDVFGYYQTSFVQSCFDWFKNGPLWPMLEADIEKIAVMKLQRSDFTHAELERVIKYNEMECKVLVLLVTTLFEAMDEAGIKLRRYDGAGSIAAALLAMNHIQDYRGTQPVEQQYYAQQAYSGGRIEVPQVGSLESKDGSDVAWRLDINSAYPSAALELPDLTNAIWKLERHWNGSPFSLVDHEWHFPKGRPFYPFFYREHDGATIRYPQEGRGIHFGVEIESAHEGEWINPDRDKNITIYQSYNCYLPKKYKKPFTFIKGVYKQRQIFKRAKSMAEKALKLGLNSIYGKLAQQLGYHTGRLPTYHNLTWAGFITAKTRARLYDLAMNDPKSVVAFATDAVISTRPLDQYVKVGAGLGEWDSSSFSGITVVQAGVYWLKKDGVWQSKYRGFDKGSLEREAVLDAWTMWADESGQGLCPVCGEPTNHVHAKTTRFITVGSALSKATEAEFYQVWTRWPTAYHRLNIMPSGKRQPAKQRFVKRPCYAKALYATVPTAALCPDRPSNPYPILWLSPKEYYENRGLRDEDGMLTKVIEEEIEDSYA